ncbi:MAG: hypothetical protein JWM95_2593 [Gemmatimonadetes bacterium]|nr:hypothetical protein [Gemmatimonadota bacterium]
MTTDEIEELKLRIASRWPTAEAFYAERDDRTARLVESLVAHVTRPVEIHVDPESAEDATVQRIALVAANLTVRWARRVRVVAPVRAQLHETLRHDGCGTLVERIESEMRTADPFFDATPCAAGIKPLRLFVGPYRAGTPEADEDDFQVHAVSWTALGARLDHPAHLALADEATVAAAALAGAVGASDLFKRAIGHEPSKWMKTFAWDTWCSELVLDTNAWHSVVARPVPGTLDVGRLLLAGVGAIGSALAYLMGMMRLTGNLTLFDRDAVDGTNLNRSPLFTVLDAFEGASKTAVAKRWLSAHSYLSVSSIDGIWRDHAHTFGETPFDAWISLTNEDGAWASVPFQLPPVVLQGTTTSGWGFGAGRHIPRVEDCTMCRMPRPEAAFRGPCAMGELPSVVDQQEVKVPVASLPFLSTASAALVMAMMMQLEGGRDALNLPNQASVDLGTGLPAVVVLHRGPTAGCRGCKAMQSSGWVTRGARGRYGALSTRAGVAVGETCPDRSPEAQVAK